MARPDPPTARPDPLQRALANLRPTTDWLDADGVAALAPWPGAYALALRLDRPTPFRRPGLAHVFRPGWYVYAGSAYGPGGVRARLARHLRPEKSARWHVDQLTAPAAAIHALGFAGGAECAIVAGLDARADFAPPLGGFGASDCRICTAHLLAWRDSGRGRNLERYGSTHDVIFR